MQRERGVTGFSTEARRALRNWDAAVLAACKSAAAGWIELDAGSKTIW